MREIKYSDKPITIGDFLNTDAIGKGEFQKIVPLLLSRTDLTEPEILSLDVEELQEVIQKISDAMSKANTLQNWGKGIKMSFE